MCFRVGQLQGRDCHQEPVLHGQRGSGRGIQSSPSSRSSQGTPSQQQQQQQQQFQQHRTEECDRIQLDENKSTNLHFVPKKNTKQDRIMKDVEVKQKLYFCRLLSLYPSFNLRCKRKPSHCSLF